VTDPISTRARHAWADAYGILRIGWTMWRKLRENRDKAHWLQADGDDIYYMARLSEEADELRSAVLGLEPEENLQREAADVANFAMMIHERARHRRKT
jgi:NTP pyrophosphatase (non-canonical NTP hydrolase)